MKPIRTGSLSVPASGTRLIVIDDVRKRMNGLVRTGETDGPPLDPGITLVITGARSTIPHRLTLAQQARDPGHVLWVDARDTASTYTLYALATDGHHLEGIEIARAWTAYQHHTLVRTLVERTTPRTRLLVLPDVCALYRDDDVDDAVAEPLLASALEMVAELARAARVPTLVTAPAAERPVLAPYVESTVRASAARRSTGLVPHAAGDHRGLQTTLPDWVDRVGERRDPLSIVDRSVGERQAVLGRQQHF